MNKKIFYYVIFLFSFTEVYAQSVGSVSSYGGTLSTKSVASGGTSSDVSETVYIGPGNHSIQGTWEIYARQVVIDPAAIISGGGRIDYYNPSIAGGLASITLIDGNASTNNIDVDLQLLNTSGMQLSEMTFPLSHLSSGWTNNTGASTLYVGRNLALAADGADIILGTGIPGDLRFDNDANVLNYRPERMIIVNNSILSHVVKENFTSAFIFPVGIADGDYTPVQISNSSANTVYVSVQDYAASASDEATADPGAGGFPADGIQRTWHIFGDVSGSGTDINLQHNSITNQSGFSDLSHFVTQWSATVPNATGDNIVPFSSSAWQSNTTGPGATGTMTTPPGVLAGSSMRNRVYSSIAASGIAEESYFTKSADASHPLPLHFISNKAIVKQCSIELDWTINPESHVQSFNIVHSSNAKDYKTIGSIPSVKGLLNYNFIHNNADDNNNFYYIEMILADESKVRSSTMKAWKKCPAATIKIYPNPAQDFITIEHLNSGLNTLSFYSADGKLIIRKEVSKAQNNKFSLDIHTVAKGVYYLKIVDESGKEESFKVIKD